MLFATLSYFVFFSLVFSAYWQLRGRRLQNGLILVASYAFYSWWDYRFAGLMLVSTIVDYFVSIGICGSKNVFKRKALLCVSLLANLGLLFFFKYYNFFIESFGGLLESLGFSANQYALQIILPLGISFYTFQTISYTIDIYRDRLKACRSFIDYAAYVSFFPQLVAGPIERGARLIPQFQAERHFSVEQAKDGLRLALWGLAKKLIIADNLVVYVDPVYADPSAASPVALAMATIAFAFQIYCDFSAYSDIAIGSARLLGFELMRNFAFPYFSRDLGEFWRRWHISLSTWFRDYLFLPLGGSKGGTWAVRRNIILTFGISGLWHGASWTFVAWGLLNGIGYLLFQSQRKRTATQTPLGEAIFPSEIAILKAGLVFLFVCATWVFFRAENFGDAITIFGKLKTLAFDWSLLFQEKQNVYTAFYYIIPFVVIEFFTRGHWHPFEIVAKWPVAIRWTIYTILLINILYLMPGKQSFFVYFQF